ncbi:hypothetical protein TNCV_3263421 [Trichonephila clavipes]|nr:hypothetical protein TNCV_3263421 [Trichonephila clavipes]
MAALCLATGWYKRQHLSEETPAKPFLCMRSPSSALVAPLNRLIFPRKSLRDDNIYVCNSSVRVYITEFLLNGCSAPDKALLVKLFYMNEESAAIALRKFRVQKNVKSGKGPITPAGLLKLVKRFEGTGKLGRMEHNPDDHA